MTSRAVLAYVVALLPAAALASAYDVEARTEAQVDTISGSTAVAGRPLLRRRIVQVLDLAGFELLQGEDAGVNLTVRFDADFAVSDADVRRVGDAYRDRFQLLGGRLHWDGIAGGRVDLDAGRIVALDPLTFFSFDGGRATVRPVPWLAVTAFGGARVTGASWLGSATFAPDGVRTSDIRRIRAGVVPILPCPDPSELCADPTLGEVEPTLGGRVALLHLPGGFASGVELEWRRTLRSGSIVEDRVGGGAHYRVGPVALDGATEWDLYLARLTALRLGARWAVARWLGLSAEAAHWHPSFSADSLFNLFDTAPLREVRLRADVTPGRWRWYVAGGAQKYTPTAFGAAELRDEGGYAPFGAAGASGEVGGTQLFADATLQGGVQGRQGWLTLVARQGWHGWLTVEGRGTLASLADPLQPLNEGTFAAAALLLSGRLERRARLSLLVEDSTPRFTRNDLRLFAFLTLGADWDSRAP